MSKRSLPQTYVEDEDEAQTLIVTLRDATLGVTLELAYTIYRDRPVITRSARLINHSEQAVDLEKVASMQMDLPTQPLDAISLPGSYARERQLSRERLHRGVTQFESRRGASSHHMNPFVALADPNTNEFQGNVLGALLIYSGNHQVSLERDPIGQTRLTMGINEYNFDWRLAAGDSFQTPEVAMVYSTTGLNGMSQTYHDLLRDRVARSGGGGRFDAGLIYYMPQSWPSDNNDPIERLKIQYGTSLVYPISAITAHVGTSPDELLGRSTSMKMRGAVAMSGTLGYELDAAQLSDADKQAVIRQVAFYKQHRELVQYGTFYRLESPFESNTVAWMFVSPDQKEALLFTFVILGAVQPEPHITKLAGLDPQQTYVETDTNKMYGGDELMQLGLYTTPVQTSDFTAQVHYFKAKD
ncbi:Alpha-galactosidase [Lentilactobacillus parabuchneri]|nr:Alpha-galactosidase [Lentilactobacillus parabuchneri]